MCTGNHCRGFTSGQSSDNLKFRHRKVRSELLKHLELPESHGDLYLLCFYNIWHLKSFEKHRILLSLSNRLGLFARR